MNKEKSYIINNSVFSIIFGDIIDSHAEVIVSSDDNLISMGGGVSASIRSKAGNYIKKEAQKMIPTELGDVVVSSAGDMEQKYIFHCITLIIANRKRVRMTDRSSQQFVVQSCFEKCFRLMPLLGVSSIAFPIVGSHYAKISFEDNAAAIAQFVTEFCYSTNKHYEIELYIPSHEFGFDVMDYIVFFEEISKQIYSFKNRPKSALQINKILPTFTHEQMASNQLKKRSIQVFISYSRANAEQAHLFCDILERMGVSYWIDVEGNYSGSNFKEEIVDAIENSSLVIFLSSRDSNKSKNVIKEISLAVALNKSILPIRLDDSQYAKSIRFDLSDIDWIDFAPTLQDRAIQRFKNTIELFIKNYENRENQ